MRMTRMFKYIVPVCTLLFLFSCGSSRKAVEGGASVDGTYSASEILSAVQSSNLTAKSIVAKVKVRLDMAGDDISTSGTLRMKRDEVIQLSLVDPLLGITEVARMEFQKDRVLIIDRINHRYVEEPYSRVSFLQRANVDFNTLQSLFWNEVFQPGTNRPSSDAFSVATIVGGRPSVKFTDRILTYTFETDPSSRLLSKTSISTTSGGNYRVDFDYSDFQDFDGKKFPGDMQLQFKAGTKSMNLTFRIGSLREDNGWDTKTAVSRRYEKVDDEKILKLK